jgi:biopolymer transport protein ExbB
LACGVSNRIYFKFLITNSLTKKNFIMETTQKKSTKIVGIKNAGLVIICCFIIAVCIYHFILGNPTNFMNNDPNNHPLPGNFMGTIYKGGVIVPVIQTLLLTVLALSIERYFALRSAFGRGSLVKFVSNIKEALSAGDLRKAQEICDKQRGSVANVVTSTLRKYEEMENESSLSKDQKLLAIQKELEEATALELPMMEQNLPIIGTITTLGTLMGLLGTVIGMIRSFAALAAGGSADSMALSQGISEALINTAFGILTGALAVISYNYYTNKIDKLTYSLDEVGFSIVQTFAATHK